MQGQNASLRCAPKLLRVLPFPLTNAKSRLAHAKAGTLPRAEEPFRPGLMSFFPLENRAPDFPREIPPGFATSPIFNITYMRNGRPSNRARLRAHLSVKELGNRIRTAALARTMRLFKTACTERRAFERKRRAREASHGWPLARRLKRSSSTQAGSAARRSCSGVRRGDAETRQE